MFVSGSVTAVATVIVSWLAFGTESWLAFPDTLPAFSHVHLTECNASWWKMQSMATPPANALQAAALAAGTLLATPYLFVCAPTILAFLFRIGLKTAFAAMNFPRRRCTRAHRRLLHGQANRDRRDTDRNNFDPGQGSFAVATHGGAGVGRRRHLVDPFRMAFAVAAGTTTGTASLSSMGQLELPHLAQACQ